MVNQQTDSTDQTSGTRWQPTSTLDPDRVLAWTVLLSVATALVGTILATQLGPGLTPDSASYISAGLNLARGNGLRIYSGEITTIFPPGFPGIIAIGKVLGVDPALTIRMVNALSVAGIILLSTIAIRRHVQSAVVTAISVVVVATSTTVLEVSSMAWSEPAFITLSLGFVLVLERLSTVEEPSWRLILTAGTLASLAFLFRYSAIALIPIGIASLMRRGAKDGWPSTIRLIFRFSMASLVVPAIWMGRNYLTARNLLGPRPPSIDSISVSVQRFSETLGTFILPGPFFGGLQPAAGAIVIVGFAVYAVWSIVRRPPAPSLHPDGKTSRLPYVLFVAIYSIYLIGSSVVTALDPLDGRLLSPLYPFVIVLVASFLDDLLTGMSRFTQYLLLVSACCIVVSQLMAFTDYVKLSSSNGLGFASTYWQESDLAQTVDSLPEPAIIYSNLPFGLWLINGREPVLSSPAKYEYRSNRAFDLDEYFVDDIGCSDSYLVWFDRGPGYMFFPDELREYISLDVMSLESDGTLYRLSPLTNKNKPCDGD